MDRCVLEFTLLSDATFGRGDGVPGVVDEEVQHDASGLPYLGGRALKGLLVEACAEILFALRLQGRHERWAAAAQRLFGRPGSGTEDRGSLEVGDALLPRRLRDAVRIGVENGDLRRDQVLESLTAVRWQTAVDPESGVAADETLRSSRVILRQTPFRAELRFTRPPTDDERALLAACVKAFRRAGSGRNRGRGELKARLRDAAGVEVTDAWFEQFCREVRG